jgi:hypothetical protein
MGFVLKDYEKKEKMKWKTILQNQGLNLPQRL